MTHNTSARGVAGLLSLSLAAIALFHHVPARAHDPHHTVVSSESIAWGAAPPSLPPGAPGRNPAGPSR